MAEWKETELGQMPVGWDVKTVDEIKSTERKSIISGPFGSNISSKFFVTAGIPVIRGNNLSLDVGKRFVDEGFVFITPDKATELGTWATKDDLIFTAAGTIGQVGILTGNEKYSKYIISNKQLRVRFNRALVEPLFAYYWFASPFMINTINGSDTGSTIPLINLSVLKGLPIPLPPLNEQQAIIEVLSSLDTKIDLLHRQNKTLKALAETLFRQWFFEEAEESWESGKLGDVLELVYGKSLKEEFRTGKGFPAVGSSGVVGYHSEFLVEAPGIVIGRKGTLGKVFYLFENFFPIDTTYFVRSKINSVGLFYEYFLLRTLNFEDMNTDSAVPGLNREIALSTKIKIPPPMKIEKYNRHCSNLFEKLNQNTIQVHSLTTLRDTLLPKLMSGEVRVKTDESKMVVAG